MMAVGRDDQPGHRVGVLQDQCRVFLAGVQIPVADGFVAAGREQMAAAGHKSPGDDAARMAFEPLDDIAGVGGVDQAVPAGVARHQQAIVGRKGHGGYG